MRRPVRLALSVLVALGAGGGLAAAQVVLRAQAPPEIVTDLEGPLFSLQSMTPGAAPIERCVTVYPRGGRADDVFVSGDVRGDLAPLVREEITAGRAADGVRASRSCDGFVPQTVLWTGTLDTFPTDGAPLRDAAPLAPGEPRVYRFRASLVDDQGPVPLDWQAEQDLRWRAELDPVAPPTTGTTVVTQTETVTVPGAPGPAPAPVTPAPPAPAPAPAPAAPKAPAAPACVDQPAERPTRYFVVRGRRVALIVGPTRRLRAGEPLTLRVRDPKRQVRQATFELDGRRLEASSRRPWRATVDMEDLAPGTSRVLVRLVDRTGRVRYGRVELRRRPCPVLVRATAYDARPGGIVLHLDPGIAVRRIGLKLPRGVRIQRRGLRAAANPRRRVAFRVRRGRVTFGAVRQGTALRLKLPATRRSRRALALARCARSPIVVRIDPVRGKPRYVKVPLQGRGGGCRR